MSASNSGNSQRPRILVTAGPTAEDIDPIRYITNRSSGRMGMEIARAVKMAGAEPFLILGPTRLVPPPGIHVLNVRSAADMAKAVEKNFAWADALVMAAAVADYTPAEPMQVKLKKSDGDLVLHLKRTKDILSALKDLPSRRGKFIAGFSLDVDVNLNEGLRKLQEKDLDLIVVNNVSSFGGDRENACILTPTEKEDCGDIPKDQLAAKIVKRIVRWYEAHS